MSPKISYLERDGRLVISIYLNQKNRGMYDTGIAINTALWDGDRLTSGDLDIDAWMATTKAALLKQFRPDMTPKRLWMSFVNNQSETTATIKDAFEYYLANMKLRDNSKSVYTSIGRTLQRAGIYDTPLTEITPGLIRSFINKLGTQDSSKFNTLVRVKATLTRYVKDHRLNINFDFEGIAPKPKYVPKDEEWLTLEQVQKLLDAPLKWGKRDARDLFCLCCFTGMSISDALVFDPRKNIKEINGRDFIVFNRIKTGTECKVPIIAQAKTIIDAREWPIKIQRRSYQYNVGKFAELVGKRMHTHLARKTFGCLFLEFGFSIETVSKLMGHSNPLITSKIYSKVTQEKVERELAEIGI